jgi:small-conductance mechanosensitive channel
MPKETTAALPGIDELIDRVFVTPRVVDQRALEEWSGSLRELVKSAAAQSQALQAAGSEVRILSEQLREASRELGARVEAAVRLVPPTAPAGTPAAVAGSDLAGVVEPLVREMVERLVQERVGALEARLTAKAPGGTGAVSGASAQGSADVLARVSQAQSALDAAADQAVIRVAALAEQVDSMITRLDTARELLDGRIVEAQAQSAGACAAIEAARASALEAGVALGAAVSEAERRVQVVSTGVESTLADLRRRAGRTMTEMSATAEASGPGEDAAGLMMRADEVAKRLEEVTRSAAVTGEGLSRLVAHATAVGEGLNDLVKQARPAPSPR